MRVQINVYALYCVLGSGKAYKNKHSLMIGTIKPGSKSRPVYD